MNHPTPDAAERQQALDPTQSFIVQAPAGSGKTGLLIQRYLKLLAYIDEPEEIVAITFTRKAAAEMRERILTALASAQSSLADKDAYAASIHALAVSALQQDAKKGWQILENPARLRIQTIDALCASLTRQMPLLSKFGAQPESIEDASDLYQEAARTTIDSIEQDHAVAADIEHLLTHLDNNRARVEDLLATMLAKRDLWLRHLHGKTREELESAFEHIHYETIIKLIDLFPDHIHTALREIIQHAAYQLESNHDEKAITLTGDFSLPPVDWDINSWLSVGALLLTKEGDWRKRLTKHEGFPPGENKSEKVAAKAWKERLTTLIDTIKSDEAFRQTLHVTRSLPPTTYSDSQWTILGALTRLLPYAVAQLKIIFQINGKVDFTEISQGALQALGEPGMPTDLALALDYRINHLLIDEFQDTSISQYKLIEKIIAGWEVGDGRSLFIVGDPMQSIYRFREAEVGLFLQTRTQGIGNISLQSLTLSANFRSQKGIVDWVNTTFSEMMPAKQELSSGAITYSPSIATHAASSNLAVTIHPFFNCDAHTEAQQVVDIIMQSQQDNPDASIAILARNRSHLNDIIPHIKAHHLPFRAIEIESLSHKTVVQDLLTLTRALINPADQIAWFSLLRAPWCGLRLSDLSKLVLTPARNNVCTVWTLINDENQVGLLSHEGANRLHRIRGALKPFMRNRLRQSLRTSVETVWHILGGPGICHSLTKDQDAGTNNLTDAKIYLDYLETQEQASTINDLAHFQKNLARLYASPDLSADERLQIMTIHKAKGLEFDCVIVPGLNRTPRNPDKQLLKWMERPCNELFGDIDLLLAPIPSIGIKEEPAYTWIQKKDTEKDHLEIERLLYVATTRARKALHLLGNVKIDEQLNITTPGTGSLLNKLWPSTQSFYTQAAQQINAANNTNATQIENAAAEKQIIIDQTNYRLPSDWVLPPAPKAVNWQHPQEKPTAQDDIEFSWASDRARHIGNIVHYWLQRIAEDHLQGWDQRRIQTLQNTFRQGLIMSGASGTPTEIDQAIERINAALLYSITDPQGKWILGPQNNAANELPLTGIIDGQCINLIIDRTFCDEKGIRWIIDYKTSSHEGSDIASFLDQEETRYRQQLNRYATLMYIHDPHHPIQLGLYFPLLKAWRAWQA